MSTINNGGPAFPYPETEDFAGHVGMTLRDYFAAKAMAQYLAQQQADLREIEKDESPTSGAFEDFDIAEMAYAMADAMLKAREVTP